MNIAEIMGLSQTKSQKAMHNLPFQSIASLSFGGTNLKFASLPSHIPQR